MKKFLAAAVMAALFAPGAFAADVTAAEFVAKASESGLAEVQKGRLAASKGQSAEVRAFGQRMVTDHGKANSELESIAGRKQLRLTKEVGNLQQRAIDDLGAKSGADFDREFARQMVADHATAVTLFTQASKLEDADLAGFASRTLPVLQDHHEKSQHLDGKH